MRNNILLKSANTIFEPHILSNQELPFIYHEDIVHGCGIANIHENLELLFFTAGSGFVKCDATTYPVQTGDVVVVNAYIAHQVIAKESVHCFCLIIDNDFCKYNSIDACKLQFSPFIQDPLLNEKMQHIMDECTAHKAFAYTGIKCAVLDLLLFLCRNYSCTRTEPFFIKDSAFEYVRLSIEYIKINIHKKLTVDEVAASVGLSKYYFLREFKKITGYTLTTYINIIRCEYAKELLSSGQYKVKEVASLCGFENDSYFSNVFKKHTGTLPSDHLKANG